MSSSTSALCAALLLAACVACQMVSAKPPVSNAAAVPNEPLPMGDDGSLFLAGNECGPDERLAMGSLPMCEPTCENPRPVCPKVFFSGVDFVPCFCKAPLVRNLSTKQCVQLSECPPAQVLPPIHKIISH